MQKRVIMVLCGLICAAAGMRASEIGFIEDFSLAVDRAAPLAQLIPGTDDYYYYTALQLQNEGRLDAVDKVLQTWIDRR